MTPYKAKLIKAAAKVIEKCFLDGNYNINYIAEKVTEAQLAIGPKKRRKKIHIQ